MTCPSCAHANRPGAKFCEECATPLKRACASCDAELRPTAKFCDECGTPVGGAAPTPRPAEPASARKIVTIVFADLVGSTALHERLDPESARRFMESYYAAMRGAVESQGGTVTQLLGDGVKAVFGIPRVAEDDAIRAVRAAVAMQEAFRALAEQQRGAVGKTGLRVAVNSGEVVANDETEIIGDPVNVAARLQEQGKDGDVVVGESTHRLVSTLVTLELLGSFALKGRSEAVKAYRVVSLERPAGAATGPFVGRGEELERLSAVYETAVEKPAAALAVLVGSPGLGKSRLIDEFARRAGASATVIRAHCDAAGGATFAPLAQALRALLGIEDGASADVLRSTIESALPEDADRTRIAGGVVALLSGSPASPEETFFVVRRLLGALAQAKPVVLVVDDLHWAEPLLLDLVEHLIQWGSGVPLVVLIGARPELRDLRSSLVTPGGLVSDVITLHGLDAGAAMRLAANVIGAADLPAAIAAKVLATSEGNPLFVGELVRMLVQEGALTKDGERWTVGANLAALEMPPTIHALLAARIERLRPEERTVLERAAVVGRHFSRSAVAALMPREAADMDARLEALRRSELIERDTGWLLGEPVLRFHHVLIRDAAYRRLLKGTRAELHAKLAAWIEAQVGDAAEHDETIGWHLEQAHAFLGELGPLDENGKRLGARAAERLASAGRRALARDDLPVAAGLLGRAIERLDADDPARADLALDWCEALLAAGDVAPAAAAIDELGRFTADSDRLRAWHTCFAGQHTVLTAPSQLHATADTVAAAAEALTALGDAAGEAKAHFVYALALSRLGKVGACEAALDRALAAARRAGDRRRANTVLAIAPLAALWGPSPVTRASGRCLDVVRVLRITQGAPAVEAVALSCQGVLEALRGRGEAARRMIASARKMVEELGITQRLLEADVFGGLVELLEGDAIAAERNLRGAYEGLRELGLGIDAARAAALLARALLAQARVAEAEALSHQSEALAGEDLKAAIAWRGVRAEALARRGEHAAAVEFASKAVELAAATDALLDHADARLALAAALRAAGRAREAHAEESRATELWQAKGATLLAERTAHAAAPVAPSVAAAAPRAAHAPRRRRVGPNFAFEEMRRAEAAVAVSDARALEAVYLRDIEIVDHRFGITYGHAAIVERVRAIIDDSTESAFAHEALAALGDSLALCRLRSTAAGSTAHGVSIGATEAPYLLVIEADEQGSARHIEIFGDDKLGDAVVRLYERHAELLLEAAERSRAEGFAAAIAAMASQPDAVRRATVFEPEIEMVDHRTIATWSASGAAAVCRQFESIDAVADQPTLRDQDVLALEPGALLMLRTHTGIAKQGGRAYERRFLTLLAAGAGGRLARLEWFDADRETEALARFDALVADTAPKPGARSPVRANAATRAFERFAATLAARDRDGLAQHFDESLQVVHHPTRATYSRREMLTTWRSTLKAERVEFRQEILASLGDTLALDHHLVSVEGLSEAHLAAFGPTEFDEISLLEVDERGRWLRSEIFAADHLGDAVARFYERYAEQLPAGAARARAEATARSVAAVAPGGFDRERYTAAFRPDVEIADHRLLGFVSDVGLDTLFRSMAAASEVGDQVVSRPLEVIALTHDALLLRWLASGVGRESGGAFEWAFLRLFVFDADGRVARYELFDTERETEALARFDELAGVGEAAPREHPFANAAARANRRRTDSFNARDWAGVEACASPDLVSDERRRLLHSVADRQDWLEQTRLLFDLPESRFTIELLATRGERLSLHRHEFEGAVPGGGGPLALDPHLALHEVDGDGHIVAIVLFDLGDWEAAYAELDARFDAGEGTAHPRPLAAWRRRERAYATRDWDDLRASSSPGFVFRDHRLLGWGTPTSHGVSIDQINQSLVDLAPDVHRRHDHVRLCDRGMLEQMAQVGTRDGGAFENVFLAVYEWDAQGRGQATDNYDVHRFDLARARFAELENATRQPRFANTASRALDKLMAAWSARDWDAYARVLAGEYRQSDRRRLVRLEFDREQAIAFARQIGEMATTRVEAEELIATRGDRLALSRLRVEAAEGALGASEIVSLMLTETNDRGECGSQVHFDVEDLDTAYAELDARFEAGEGAAHPLAAKWLADYLRYFATRDWDGMRARFAPDLVGHNHRLVGWGTLHGPAALVSTLEAQVALAPDTRERVDHVRSCERGVLFEYAWHGTHEGGAFENVWLVLVELEDAGRARRADVWEAEQQADALTRFDALQAARDSFSRFANAATATSAPVIAALAAHDWTGFEALFAESCRCSDRRRVVQLDFDRASYVAFTREGADGREIRGEAVALATRGERLALVHSTFEFTGGDVGPSEIAFLLVTEVDERGRIVAYVRFDPDDRDAAYAELDARFVADASQAHGHTTVAFDRAVARRDWDAVAALCAPAFVEHDHRSLAVLGTTHGAAAWTQNFRTLVELAPDTIYRSLHVRSAARGFLSVGTWQGSREGGRYEIPLIAVLEVDAHGAIARADIYEPDQLGQALARFRELEATPTSPFANAATRSAEVSVATWMAADWERFARLFPADAHLSDRRRAVQLELGRDELIAFSRSLGEHATTRIIDVETLATRGERLALQRWRIELAGDGVGASEISHLTLIEKDERGLQKGAVRWDDDAIDAAWAELDARFEAGEGAAHPHALAAHVATNAAIQSRDWDALAALCAPTFRMRDHRRLGWGTIVNDAATFVRMIRSAVELAPDSRYRDDHLRICARGTLSGMVLCGTREGGAFENPFLRVTEVDEQGRILSHDIYDESDVDRALARFAELAAPAAPEGRFENAASRAWRAVNEAWTARDLERFAAPHAAALRYRDHRRLFELDLDRAGFLDFTRPLLTMRTGSAALALVATRGERLALMHSTMEMADESVGPSVIESLMLIATDERGDIAAYDRWDLEDEDAAWAEIEARWKAGEGAQASKLWAVRELFGAALERRDWDAVAACYAPDFVGHDCRLVSWGTVHGPSGQVRTLQEMVGLAPDARMRQNHRRVCTRGEIRDITWLGTRDGGAFESPCVTVTEYGADGRIVRADFYDPHHLDRAFARFAEIRAKEPRDPLAASAKPNLATAAMARNWATFDVLDLDAAQAALDAARAHYAPDFVWEDRRPVVGLAGGLDLMLASVRERLASGARQQRTIVGTAGDRVAIGRVLWAGGPADGRFEVEFLVVAEVNEAGLFTALIFFEPDDTRAAQREAWTRWAAIDPVVAPWVEVLTEIGDAWNGRDRERLLARFAADVVVVDHRHTGIGRIEGSAAYVDANAVLWDLAPDQRIEFGSSFLAFDRHGLVATLRRAGTLADGGAFESEYVWLSLARDGRITHLELFEIEQQAAALAHFEELRPEPLRVPPNAATRAIDRTAPLLASGGLEALRSIVTDDFCLDDRTRRAQLSGGVEEWLRGLEFLRTEMRGQLRTRLLATAGDRLALRHAAWRETPGESSFLIERLHVIEVDAAGKLRAFVIFDADDLAAAHTELFERHVALGADGMPACLVECKRALDARDMDRVRAVLADDFVYHDRRRTGAGRVDGPDAYLASPRAWWELSDDARIDTLYFAAVAPHGRVAVSRMAGRNREGGDCESFMVTLVWTQGERLAGAEMFEIDQLDAALARLEELRPEPLRVPQTAATRMRDRHRNAFLARDWDAMRALAGADFVYDDRGKRALVRGNVEAWIASMEFTTQPGFRSESAIIGTLGDRIVLDHLRWFGKPDGDAFEFERFRLLEVGADGLMRAVVFFDPEDRFAASIEGLARFAAGGAAGSAGIAPLLAFLRALGDRAWEAVRECLAPDLVLVEHRPLINLGTLDREQWIASLQAVDELGDGVIWEVFRVPAWSDRGFVATVRRLGTIADGGGPFEVEAIVTALVVDGRMQRVELFGEADAERAVARFEALRSTTGA